MVEGKRLLVGSVRLYETTSLRRRLPAAAKPMSDGQLVLAALARWGEEGLHHLDGEFAFAVWDDRCDRALLVRDRMGTRPLWWHTSAKGLWVGPSPASVRDLPDVETCLDEEWLVRSLATRLTPLGFRADDLHSGPYLGIVELLAGHLATWNPGRGAEARRWWSPAFDRPPPARRPEDCAALLRIELLEAVGRRTRGATGLATELSGGLDSSFVAAAAAKNTTYLPAYSFVLPAGSNDPGGDEHAFARVMADYVPGLDLIPVTGERAPSAVELARLGWSHHGHHSVQPVEHEMLHHAASHGVQDMLSGQGGDEWASHNGRTLLAELLSRGRVLRLAREAKAWSRGRSRSTLGVVWTSAAKPWLLPLHSKLRPPRPPLPPELELLAPSIRRPVANVIAGMEAAGRPIRLRDLYDAYLKLGAGGLTAGWAWPYAASFGIEYRYPLLDHRLVDLAVSFPYDVWRVDGWHRFVYRLATDEVLPDRIRWRTDKRPPLPGWHRRQEERRTRLHRELGRLSGSPLARRYLDVDALVAAVKSTAPQERSELLLAVVEVAQFLDWHVDELGW